MGLEKLVLGAALVVALVTPVGLSIDASASQVSETPLAYAQSVLATVPVPAGATPVASLPTTLVDSSGAPAGVSGVVTVGRDFEVPISMNLSAFFDTHLPSNRDPGGCSTNSTDTGTQYSCQRTLVCANRHAALCGAAYTFETFGATKELRVSVYVVWRAIVKASFPSGGVVTVTGYARSSALSGSSGTLSASPTYAQRRTLAAAIAGLRGAPGGICMEDGTLFSITVRPRAQGRVIWRATADICPGVLVVTRAGHHVGFNARDCALTRAVAAVLPTAARASREMLANCL